MSESTKTERMVIDDLRRALAGELEFGRRIERIPSERKVIHDPRPERRRF